MRLIYLHGLDSDSNAIKAQITDAYCQEYLTSAVNNGEKHLVDFIRQPDGKSLGILGQVT